MLTIEQAVTRQRSYRATEEHRQQLSDTTLIATVGATAVGKNFLMEKSGLPVVGTLTTREPRSSDDPGRYSYVDLPEMLSMIEQGELIQYGAYPPHIYGSRLNDYALGQPNIADIYFNAVDDLKNKGFDTVKALSILTPKEQWMSQLMERFEGMQVGAIHSRLTEARHSLRWTRAQQLGIRATSHLVIINSVDNADENVSRMHDFAEGRDVEPLDDEVIIKYIEGMEAAIEALYSRLEA
jgi:guanylate kinase